MTQVKVLTIDNRELISLNNRKAESKDRPPKGSPYKLTKEQLEIVSYVKGSCFQALTDRITGERYKTRYWLDNWFHLSLKSLNTLVDKELDPYLGSIIQLDGVSDVYGYMYETYNFPATNGADKHVSTIKNFRKYVKQVFIEVRSGKPTMYEVHGEWRFDPHYSGKIEVVGVRTEKEMITAIARHSAQLQAVES